MQITVKSTKVAKTGTNKNGPWELIVVKAEDGTDYTTFKTGAKNLAPGTVIELDEITIKGDTKSFKEYAVVSAPAISSVNSMLANGNNMTPELWAEKDRLDRVSQEGRVAMESMTQAATHFVIDAEKDPSLFNLWKQAMKVKLEAFIGTATESQVVKVAPKDKTAEAIVHGAEQAGKLLYKKAPDGEEPTFENNGQLMTYLKEHGIDSMTVCTVLSINSPRDIKDPNKAYQDLKHLIKPVDPTGLFEHE